MTNILPLETYRAILLVKKAVEYTQLGNSINAHKDESTVHVREMKARREKLREWMKKHRPRPRALLHLKHEGTATR